MLRHVPLRRKLAAIAIANVATALLIGSAIVLGWDFSSARRQLVGDLQSQATIAATSTTSALTSGDRVGARRALTAFRAAPAIQRACLYDAGGRIFAEYQDPYIEPCPPSPPADGSRFARRTLQQTRAVILEQRRIGTVALLSDLSPVYSRLRALAIGVGIALLASSLVVLLIASRLHRYVTDPILSLAQVARAVSSPHNYGLRAQKLGNDEIGQLVDAFNGMLGEIQERDAALLRANEMLEQRVAERTAALERELTERRRAEELLAERNDELVRSNQDLDDFAYITSHDLREPLRGIYQYASFLTEDYGNRLDPDGLARLDTLRRLSRRMQDLIESLLHYSRLGRVDLAFTDVDLTAAVDEVLESLEIGLREGRVDARVQRPLPVVRCDRVRVAEVFRNLITNAMKYNDKVDRWIEVGAMREPGQPQVLYVRDNGIGIPAKHRETVFRIFKRLHARDRFGGGTGAGLTIVRKIVERHQGAVWIESTPGDGTTVFFTLEKGVHHAPAPWSADSPGRG
jgi:signal transduction histidine kinase